MELTAPIVLKDLHRRIVYGPVLIPDLPDSDGDVVSADKIEEVAHRFMLEYGLMEDMHTLKSVAHPVESFIAPTALDLGEVRIPKGSWVVGAKVVDDGAWDRVKSGQLKGFSVVAVPNGAMKGMAAKKLTLAQIEASGQDWEVIAIGLVDEPAIPLAKWTTVKSAEGSSVLDKFRALFTQEDVQVLLGSSKESSREEGADDMDEKEIAALVGSAVTEALSPVTDRLDAIEATGKTLADKEAAEAKKAKEDAEGGPKTITLTEEQIAEAVQNASKTAAKEAVAEVLVKFEEHIEAMPGQVSSKSLAESLRGQDGDGTAKKGAEGVNRDAFGRRIAVNS